MLSPDSPADKEKPAKINVFTRGQALVSSAGCFQATIESIENAANGATRWMYNEEHPGEYPPQYLYRKETGQTIVEFGRTSDIQTFTPTATLSLWKEVQRFDDYDADILLAVIAQIIKTPDEHGAAWFWASQFLDNRGIVPITKTEDNSTRRAGHRTEDIIRIDEGLQRLSNLWVTIEEIIPPKRKSQKPKKYVHRGRLLMVTQTWTQEGLVLDGTPRMPLAWKVRAGDWLFEYLNAPRMVAYLCEKSLQYDYYRELWEKRLSRYFMFHLRINAKHASNMITRRVGLLIHDLSLPIDENNPQKTRKRFEKAMEKLVEDRQIDGWEYQEQETLPAKKWLDQWLEWKVNVYAMARSNENHNDQP